MSQAQQTIVLRTETATVESDRVGTETALFQQILVPIDGSERSMKAVQQAVRLAAALEPHIVFLTVTEPYHLFTIKPDQIEDTPKDYARRTAERADTILSRASAMARDAGVASGQLQVAADQPFKIIVEVAKDTGCDLIVKASHGGGRASAMVLGSQTNQVHSHSLIPVLVCRLSQEELAAVEKSGSEAA